jgi:hypothetical protein
MSRRYLTAAVLCELESRLGRRDLAILKRVSDLRFVSGSQLARMHFAGEASGSRTASRALLRLAHLGVLERLPRAVGGTQSGSASYVYRLGAAGLRLAAKRGWQPDERRRRAHIPGTLFVGHALAVAELHTMLIEADRSGRIELLELSAEPACWRRYGGIGTQCGVLKPDSYLRLGAGEYEDSYFIEVDMGSEGSWALERKLGDYLAYEASGVEQHGRGVFPKCLWLAPDGERVSAIERCVKRLPRAGQELFQVALFADAIQVMSNTSKATDSHTFAQVPSGT